MTVLEVEENVNDGVMLVCDCCWAFAGRGWSKVRGGDWPEQGSSAAAQGFAGSPSYNWTERLAK